MNNRKSKKLFYKQVTKALLNEGSVVAYVNPYIIEKVIKKLERLTKLKLIYYLHNKVEKYCFVIRKKEC